MMRAHYLQHVPFEGLGSIEAWLHNTGYEITATRFFDRPQLPDTEDIDLLIIMGGPMSIHDEQIYPWLVEEKQFIHRFITTGKPALGICLGAQLIASALGARVFPNTVKEIGWHPIRGVSNERGVFTFPEQMEVFHWHGETFSLPPEAMRIASSRACKNQAFQFRHNVIALQFHLETTPDAADAIVSHCNQELVPGPYIQSAEEILSAPIQRYEAMHILMADILDYLHPPAKNC